jgi:HEPN domain-containing protein
MKKITSEWVTKAEGDFAMLERESRARKNRSLDGICFHAQQCAEKYLKARLSETGISFPKIHDLVTLLELALPVEPTWELFRVDLAFLSEFAVAFRYPGETAEKESAINARKRCKVFRQAARSSLGLTS